MSDPDVLSLNGDFVDIVTYPPNRYKGIVALRVHNHTEILPHLMARLVEYLNLHPEMEHYCGKLFLRRRFGCCCALTQQNAKAMSFLKKSAMRFNGMCDIRTKMTFTCPGVLQRFDQKSVYEYY